MDAITNPNTDDQSQEQPRRWRDVLPVHPAAELFPLMSEAELRALAKDIKAGMKAALKAPDFALRMPVTVIEVAQSPVKIGKQPVALLDGRNRLDALRTRRIHAPLHATGDRARGVEEGVRSSLARPARQDRERARRAERDHDGAPGAVAG